MFKVDLQERNWSILKILEGPKGTFLNFPPSKTEWSHDILRSIFEYLDVNNLRNILRVSKEWRQVALRNDLWVKLGNFISLANPSLESLEMRLEKEGKLLAYVFLAFQGLNQFVD
jgi:hypothetical protein